MAGSRRIFMAGLLLVLTDFGTVRGFCADIPTTQNPGASNTQSSNVISPSSVGPLLDLFVKKGFVTQEEADQVRTEAEAQQTNQEAMMEAEMTKLNKWKISDGTKSFEIFGDIRLRYEDREAKSPSYGNIDLQRERYSVRIGFRGTLADSFYYGLRLETGSSARSPWTTFGASNNGPYAKSTAGINVGQAYIGLRQGNWLDVALGKMPNPLYTTTLVWSGNINPEGAAEQFKHTVGEADFFATFGQFLYQNLSPNNASGNLGINGSIGQTVPNIYQLAWQGGLTYHITDRLSAKAAATIYEYFGLQASTTESGTSTAPYYSDAYVGEGSFAGPGFPTMPNGASGYNPGATYTYNVPGNPAVYQSQSYPNNQVGINDLLVLEIPAELDYSFDHLKARIFGDFAYNFQGNQRAEAAAAGYSAYLFNQAQQSPNVISGFAPQTSQVKAYQIGFSLGSSNVIYGPSQGLVYGTSSANNTRWIQTCLTGTFSTGWRTCRVSVWRLPTVLLPTSSAQSATVTPPV
jgi:Putative porin